MNKELLLMQPLAYWNEWLVVIACFLIWVSCIMHLNHFEKTGHWLGKLVTGAVALSSFGVGVSPFVDGFNYPSIFDAIFYASVAGFSVWHTAPLWMELRGHAPAPQVNVSDDRV